MLEKIYYKFYDIKKFELSLFVTKSMKVYEKGSDKINVGF